MNRKSIVAGVDGSRPAENALLWAAREAQLRGAELVIAHSADSDQGFPDMQAPSADTLLTESVRLILDRGIDCDVRTVSCDEPVVALLGRLGQAAELLVIGARGLAHITGTPLGSVAYRVVAHAPCPVAVIDEQRWSTRLAADRLAGSGPVAVGVTANPNGAPAMEFAFAEAALRGVAVHAVHSWAEIDWSDVAGTTALYRTGGDFGRYFQNRMAVLLAPVRARYPEVAVQMTVSPDPVCASLAEASARSSMLVLGCRHRNSRLAPRLGPTSTRLIQLSRCPVVAVGHPQPSSVTEVAVLSISAVG
jgi:nucleotide-binding universal stress UspA family protein